MNNETEQGASMSGWAGTDIGPPHSSHDKEVQSAFVVGACGLLYVILIALLLSLSAVAGAG